MWWERALLQTRAHLGQNDPFGARGRGTGWGWDKQAIAPENAQRIPFVAVGTISYHLLTEHLLLLSPVGGILCVVTASYEVGMSPLFYKGGKRSRVVK